MIKIRIEETLDKSFNPKFFEEISGESLVEVLAKMLLIVVRLQEKIDADKLAARLQQTNKEEEDDIPF